MRRSSLCLGRGAGGDSDDDDIGDSGDCGDDVSDDRNEGHLPLRKKGLGRR